MRTSLFALLACCCFVIPAVAHADDDVSTSDGASPSPDRPKTDDAEWKRARLSVAAAPGVPLYMHRSGPSGSSSLGALAIGGEARAHFGRWHGGLFAYSAMMGPVIAQTFDLAYSLRLAGSPSLRGVTGAIYADFGPSLAILSGPLFVAEGASGLPATANEGHVTLGVRASLAADVHIWNFVLGLVGSYHVGLPVVQSNSTSEGAVALALRLGVVGDIGL